MEKYLVGDYVFKTILESVANPVFIVDGDFKIHGYNMPGGRLIDIEPDRVLGMEYGDAIHCVHSKDSANVCGGVAACKKCAIRKSVSLSYHSNKFVREKCEIQLKKDNKVENIRTMITTAPINYSDQTLVLIILEEISELIELRDILPICVKCKKIRDDKEYWQNVEKYLSNYPDIKFSRGICPKCLKILYPGLRDKK